MYTNILYMHLAIADIYGYNVYLLMSADKFKYKS